MEVTRLGKAALRIRTSEPRNVLVTWKGLFLCCQAWDFAILVVLLQEIYGDHLLPLLFLLLRRRS